MSGKEPNLKNVVVAIDPIDEKQHALERALIMNEVLDGGVNIHLFISLETEKLHSLHDTFEFSCDGEWFEGLVKPMADAGIDYTSEVVWTDVWHRSMNAIVDKYNADLVMLSDCSVKTQRTDLTASKWALLRASNCPVMIVHPDSPLKRKNILAAVNMQTDDPRYSALNEKINDYSALFAEKYGAEKHIINAYGDSMDYPDRAKLIQSTNTKQENIHVHQGDPKAIIADTAKEVEADIVVIGTLARRGVMAAMRGNKSEDIIRELNCDVLVLN